VGYKIKRGMNSKQVVHKQVDAAIYSYGEDGGVQ
jgi:hypothetical protein